MEKAFKFIEPFPSDPKNLVFNPWLLSSLQSALSYADCPIPHVKFAGPSDYRLMMGRILL